MSLKYIDLFAGAGGLSEGFQRAGYTPIAHVEMDAAACDTLRTRSAYYYLKEHKKEHIYKQYLNGEINKEQFYKSVPETALKSVIQAEVSDETMQDIFSRIDELSGQDKIDLIIGGPPCQVYSLVGRSRIGKVNVHRDKRYFLYKQYAEFLKKYQPEIFVFENVQGLLSAENGNLIKSIRHFLEECGYHIQYRLINSADYGVLQERKRLILIGRRGHFSFDYPEFEQWTEQKWTTKSALFSDLPLLKHGEGFNITKYENPLVNNYLETTHLRNGVNYVSQHITRPHNERDLEIYTIAIDKWLNKRERLKYKDLPSQLKTHKNETAFLDRFKVIDPDGCSHTIVAHLSKDGHYFIYPDETNPRSISVREAARIQSFSDDFFFEGGRSNAFKQIGNAVPPLLGEAIAKELLKLF